MYFYNDIAIENFISFCDDMIIAEEGFGDVVKNIGIGIKKTLETVWKSFLKLLSAISDKVKKFFSRGKSKKEYSSENLKLKEEIEKNQNIIKELQNRLSSSNQEKTDLNNKINDLVKKNNEMKEELKHSYDKHAILTKYRTDIVELNAEFEYLKPHIEKLPLILSRQLGHLRLIIDSNKHNDENLMGDDDLLRKVRKSCLCNDDNTEIKDYENSKFFFDRYNKKLEQIISNWGTDESFKKHVSEVMNTINTCKKTMEINKELISYYASSLNKTIKNENTVKYIMTLINICSNDWERIMVIITKLSSAVATAMTI